VGVLGGVLDGVLGGVLAASLQQEYSASVVAMHKATGPADRNMHITTFQGSTTCLFFERKRIRTFLDKYVIF
jgi:hypothetical protein